MMKSELPYPFDIEFMRQNKAFMFFCPPDCLDEDGRPVLEGRSMLYKPGSSAYRACPYRDSRADTHKPVNVESLQALMRHQNEVIAFIRETASLLRDRKIIGETGGSVGDMYALAYVCYKSPEIYFVNQVFGRQVDVPAICSIASRFFHGLVNLFAIMALEHQGALAEVDLTPEEIYCYADEGGYLIGMKEACAASKATIVKYIALAQQALLSDGDVARFTNVFLPEERTDMVIQAAQVSMSLEFHGLIYETARCRSWRQINEGDPLRGNLMEPLSRFATTHCLVAKKLSLEERPFDHLLFKRARNLSKALLIDHASSERLIESASEYINTSVRDTEARRASRERLKSDMLQFIDSHRRFVAEHVAEDGYLTADLDVFFGRWPE
ncbi:hypothetical protein CUJ89_29505 [Burkholderia pyrrocinia]|uniref:Uncharacterized protein n=1 Tax=Burkholderia pyrrocinia TaxID=60550 RepID=A0A2Z5N6E5_BURPY|nr:hypothetical protein [Burkholderia pyrrocinia]AXF24434.1 hypothetical protein CUJ89_29505 [Burkholderia pyrrocinia]